MQLSEVYSSNERTRNSHRINPASYDSAMLLRTHCVKAELAGVSYRIHYMAKTNRIPTFAKVQSTRGYALIA